MPWKIEKQGDQFKVVEAEGGAGDVGVEGGEVVGVEGGGGEGEGGEEGGGEGGDALQSCYE